MAAVKNLVYASTEEEIQNVLEIFQENPLLEIYQSFRRYLSQLLEHHKEWAVAYRSGMLLRGRHTNNFCKATICIIKDIVLSRYKTFNMSQLVMFMAEIFDMYMQQRLVGVAVGRQKVKHINVGNVPLDNVTQCDDGVYNVHSETGPSRKYQVDLRVGTCTCPKGATGAVCKHQVTCAEYSMTVIPQVFISTSENRMWLAALAVGKEKTPDIYFFQRFV